MLKSLKEGQSFELVAAEMKKLALKYQQFMKNTVY